MSESSDKKLFIDKLKAAYQEAIGKQYIVQFRSIVDAISIESYKAASNGERELVYELEDGRMANDLMVQLQTRFGLTVKYSIGSQNEDFRVSLHISGWAA